MVAIVSMMTCIRRPCGNCLTISLDGVVWLAAKALPKGRHACLITTHLLNELTHDHVDMWVWFVACGEGALELFGLTHDHVDMWTSAVLPSRSAGWCLCVVGGLRRRRS